MIDIDNLIERLTSRQQREYAIKCARRVQHLMPAPGSIAALDIAERYLRGEATDEELTEARKASEVAVWGAACAAAADAARSARAAAWAAAASAVWVAEAEEAAARAAGIAARHAAWDAERAWQREELERMLKEGGGA